MFALAGARGDFHTQTFRQLIVFLAISVLASRKTI